MPFQTNEIAEVVTLAELDEFLVDQRITTITIHADISRGRATVTFQQGGNSFTGEGKTIEEALRKGWAERPFP